MRVNPILYFVGNKFNPILLKTNLILLCILLKTNFTKKIRNMGSSWTLGGLWFVVMGFETWGGLVLLLVRYWMGNLNIFRILLKINFTKKLGTWVLVGLGVGLGS